MIQILNASLKEETSKDRSSVATIEKKIGRLLGDSHTLVKNNVNPDGPTQLGFVGFLSRAYSRHESIEIYPHDLWYIVLAEVAKAIKEREGICRPLFTRSENKVDIFVPVEDPTTIDLDAVVFHLRNLVPVDVGLFLPSLPSAPTTANLAMSAAFCDALSVYYNYMTYCCGIPQIRVMGTQDEWNTLALCSKNIRSLFSSIGYKTVTIMLDKVTGIFQRVTASFDTPDPFFWMDIFTQKNIGSGRELAINGWVTDLFLNPSRGEKLENLTLNYSVVPYLNVNTSRRFKGIYGCFEGIRVDNGFMKTGYSSLVFESTVNN